MKIFKNKSDLNKEIYLKKNISFIPTMGGLHKGHVSLINRSKKLKGKTLVSIYVNPKQFNKREDFLRYPRNIKKDLNILKKLRVDYVYLPKTSDLFGFNPKNKIFIDKFSKKLCGKTRKGHFKGVLNVINRFLEIINPKYMLLGSKDFQQMFLIKKHIFRRKIRTIILSCKTVREKNGVACSTRNKNLTSREMQIASKVFSYLKKSKKSPKILKHKFLPTMYRLGISKIEYLEILNLKTLKKAKKINEKFNIFVAYYIGKIRLIDNI